MCIRDRTYAEYRRSREEMRELLTAKANVDRVLKMEVEQDVEKEKDHGDVYKRQVLPSGILRGCRGNTRKSSLKVKQG